MTVMIVSALMNPQFGGAATVPMAVVDELRRRGHRVAVMTTGAKGRTTVAEARGVRTYALPPRNLHWIGDKNRHPVWRRAAWQLLDFWNPAIYVEAKKILERERPDVVHVHKLRGISPAIWAAATHAGCERIVQTCHDYELISPEGTLLSAVGRLAARHHWTLAPYQRPRAILSNAVAVATAPSRFTLDTIISAGMFRRARTLVIPNSHGLRSAELERNMSQRGGRGEGRGRPEPGHGDKLRLLFLGRLERNKGVDLLCEAVARCGPARVRLDVAGWGSLSSTLKERYGRQSHIRFLGAVFGRDKEAAIRSADVLVVPSVYPEVFGLVIVEAFAYGKPVIGTSCGGIPELITEGSTGFVVPAGDVVALEERIAALSADVPRVRAMSPSCYTAALAFTLDRITDQYISAYGGRSSATAS